MSGATASMLAIRMPISAMKKVKMSARMGSFLALVALKMLRNGMMSSRAIACSSRGEPARQHNSCY